MLTAGYYRCTKDLGDGDYDIKAGELIYIVSVTETRVDYIRNGEEEHVTDYEDYFNNFEFVPDGLGIRQKQIQELMADLHQPDPVTEQAKRRLGSAIHVDQSGNLATGTALVSAGSNAEAAKAAVAHVRNDVNRFKRSLQSRNMQLKALLQEQSAIMQARAAELATIVKHAEEAIWTINLYLGADEEVYTLARGEPTPMDTPICLRQLVLYMDEECALAADEGGIQFEEIEEFDRWVIQPAHLQQVLPEPRGIVALKVRRHTKHCADPWEQAARAKADKTTYFLIRNGANIYRLYTSFDAGSVLFPTQDELMDVFYEDDTDWRTHKTVKNPVKPGSEAYMKAMEAASDSRRHYLRVGLILQGLIDRTPIFEPLPGRINIGNPNECTDWLRFIYDAENLLTLNRLPFHTWLDNANAGIGIGQRVIGIFNNYSYGLPDLSRDGFRAGGRLVPRNAEYPDDLTLHTIEARGEDDAFYIYYKRTETIYRRSYDDDPAKVRARCTIRAKDKFILNFDAVNVGDMEYYLQSRINRHAYAHMFPLLKRAIKLKQEEEATEAPFHKLLAGAIVKAYPQTSFEAAEAAVPELVHWWKFKNQTHRALTSKDKLALKMIVEEFRIRQRRRDERIVLTLDGVQEEAKQAILAALPEAIYIGHKRGNEFVAYGPYNSDSVFVREQLWVCNRSSNNKGPKFRLKEDRPWQVVDKRHKRWQTIYSAERWAEWQIGVRRIDVLTDPEVETITALVFQRLEEHLKDHEDQEDDDEEGNPCCWPLAAALKDSRELTLYYCDRQAVVPAQPGLRHKEPQVVKNDIGWKRSKTAESGFTITFDSHHISYSPPGRKTMFGDREDGRPWEVGYRYAYGVERRILWTRPENIDKLDVQWQHERDYENHNRACGYKVDAALRSLTEQLTKQEQAAAFAHYLKEHGDPEVWQESLKKLTLDVPSVRALYAPFEVLVHRGVVLDRSVVQLLDMAKVAGWEEEKEDELAFYGRHNQREPLAELDQRVLTLIPEVEPDDEEEGEEES